MTRAHGTRRLRKVPLWCWWIPIVWAISLPWVGFTTQPQWSGVHWIPLTDPADKPRDVLANILLFTPFGYSFARHRASRFRILESVAAAAAVSFCAESTQLFSALRYPSATDVSAAMAGASAGAWFSVWNSTNPAQAGQ